MPKSRGFKLSMLVCLGASLSVWGDRLSLWMKMGLVGGAWVLAGGVNTAAIVLKTLPRDVRAVWKIIRLLYFIKSAQRNNLTVPKMFAKSAKRFPEKVLFYFQDEVWTFKRVEEYSNRIADFFLSSGFVKGDSVGVVMGNKPEFVCVWLGLSKIGVLPALINSNLRSEPLCHSIKVAKCRAVIFSSELAQAIESIFGMLMTDTGIYFPTYSIGAKHTSSIHGSIHLDSSLHEYSSASVSSDVQDSIQFNDKLMYIYTSGTTGLPKAAVIKHSRYRIIILTPRYLLNTPESEYESQHSVRLMFGNGLRPEIWQDFVNRFNIQDIAEFYGSTEGNSQVLNFDNKVGAVGFLPVLFSSILPLGTIKVDENGEPVRDPVSGLCIRCKAGEAGEFVGIIQQNHPMREFVGYSDKESTNKKILKDVWSKGDVCFRSGDILVSDQYGYLYFKDRRGDTYRWKGENVSTAEVEGIISRAVGLVDVVVYGVLVPGCEGRVGMAAIVEDLGSGCCVDLPKLSVDLTSKLPSYARPAFIRLVRELDMTGTFKLKKRDLQNEGFDITLIEDRVFFFQAGEYKPLTKELYSGILDGSIRM
ncbi:long-chain fatty acid transport protein 4 [Eurytemora carolleeae]|uniref:long-chain fatty acid transport protein 4 n=1 Tax=Eurytemora carolleeae TaxID=1294199 RepID=UPI000C774C1C|nr:long-chain fatty acid transport protein 4 [Eurytemora carolleeae]|eukprot:XP_023329888.1 long-chain fatty acid transport protein 4-like [Eurytemora affinis]